MAKILTKNHRTIQLGITNIKNHKKGDINQQHYYYYYYYY